MSEPTELGHGRGGQTLFIVVPAVIGAALGWGLLALLGWLLGLPWIPFRGPLELVDSIPDQVALPVLIGLGTVGVGKAIAGRARPYVTADTNARDFKLMRGLRGGSDYQSFPSGHTVMAFAAAAAVTGETARWWPDATPYIGTALYGGAALAGQVGAGDQPAQRRPAGPSSPAAVSGRQEGDPGQPAADRLTERPAAHGGPGRGDRSSG